MLYIFFKIPILIFTNIPSKLDKLNGEYLLATGTVGKIITYIKTTYQYYSDWSQFHLKNSMWNIDRAMKKKWVKQLKWIFLETLQIIDNGSSPVTLLCTK